MNMNLIDSGQKLAIKTIKNKIENFITSGIYNDLEEFINDNPDLKTFQEKTKLNNSLKRMWGYQITDEDYQNLLNELKIELEEKMRIQNEKLSTVQANGKEITTYDDGNSQIIVDNSYANMSIEEQLVQLQEKYSRFRQDPSLNTEGMMQLMQDEIKPEPSFKSVSDINNSFLSKDQEKIVEVAKSYQQESNNVVQVDFENGIILDKGQIKTVEKREDGYGVFAPSQDESEKELDSAQKPMQKTLQKNLPYKQAGFSDALVLALLTGMLLGLAVFNIYIKFN